MSEKDTREEVLEIEIAILTDVLNAVQDVRWLNNLATEKDAEKYSTSFKINNDEKTEIVNIIIRRYFGTGPARFECSVARACMSAIRISEVDDILGLQKYGESRVQKRDILARIFEIANENINEQLREDEIKSLKAVRWTKEGEN